MDYFAIAIIKMRLLKQNIMLPLPILEMVIPFSRKGVFSQKIEKYTD